jgi:hypothetical protein
MVAGDQFNFCIVWNCCPQSCEDFPATLNAFIGARCASCCGFAVSSNTWKINHITVHNQPLGLLLN